MSLRITDRQMTSTVTEHWAVPADFAEPYGRWWVSWLPGVELTRSQAITALTLAETVTSMIGDGQTMVEHTHRMWPHIHTWAGELGLAEADAFMRAGEPLAPRSTTGTVNLDGDGSYDEWMKVCRPQDGA